MTSILVIVKVLNKVKKNQVISFKLFFRKLKVHVY